MALKLSFNLSDILERSFSNAQRRALSGKVKDPAIKREFGRRAIEKILERTNDGKDKNNRSFKGYSEAYLKSDNFKIFGKSKSTVNLKLSGEMQASIGVLSTGANTVTIGIEDEEQVNKARGHINGANNLPVRDFWGLSEDEESEILKDIMRNETASEDISLIESLVKEFSLALKTRNSPQPNVSVYQEESLSELGILGTLEEIEGGNFGDI